MYVFFRILFCISWLFASGYAFVGKNSPLNCRDSTWLSENPAYVLPCAKQILPKTPIHYRFIGEKDYIFYKVYQYQFTSLDWPWLASSFPDVDPIDPKIWNHELDIYVSFWTTFIRPDTAFLIIDSGENAPPRKGSSIQSHKKTFEEQFIEMSLLTLHKIIIDLKQIPNEPLTIAEHLKKEDEIVAYTWLRFMQNPKEYIYYPLHVPMTISTELAMDLIQKIVPKDLGFHIDHFVLGGTSKRGWTTWLTAMEQKDDRILAIVPIASDFFNVEVLFNHIYKVYGQHWPIAIHDYYEAGILDYRNPTHPLYPNFKKLMQVEDMYLYLDDPVIRSRLSAISKYLIAGSGDDFFVPDAGSFYQAKIPGNQLLYYVPNMGHSFTSPHAIDVMESIIAYYDRVIHHHPIPEVKSYIFESDSTGKKLTISYTEKPIKATRWQAVNTITRDFRYACGIQYIPTPLTIGESNTSATIAIPDMGWTAAYIELEFSDGLRASSSIYVYPSTYPDSTQVMPQRDYCRLIPAP